MRRQEARDGMRLHLNESLHLFTRTTRQTRESQVSECATTKDKVSGIAEMVAGGCGVAGGCSALAS